MHTGTFGLSDVSAPTPTRIPHPSLDPAGRAAVRKLVPKAAAMLGKDATEAEVASMTWFMQRVAAGAQGEEGGGGGGGGGAPRRAY